MENKVDINYIKKIILDSLANTDVELPNNVKDDLDLTEYIYESIQYVNFIINIENELSIDLPDELIVYDNFRSLNGFANMLLEVLYNEN